MPPTPEIRTPQIFKATASISRRPTCRTISPPYNSYTGPISTPIIQTPPIRSVRQPGRCSLTALDRLRLPGISFTEQFGTVAVSTPTICPITPRTSTSISIRNALLYNGDVRSLIENAIGGTGNDTFTGNRVNNVIDGRGGTNTFVETGIHTNYSFRQLNRSEERRVGKECSCRLSAYH